MERQQRMRILFVEHDDVLRDVVGELLEMWNYQPVLAAGEEESVAKARGDTSIRVVVVEDDMRHGIDGVQTAGKLYQARQGDVYVIIHAADYQDALHRSRPYVGSWIWSVVGKGDTEKLKERLQEAKALTMLW